MTLVTGKQKKFSLFLAESGNGKTFLMFMLMKAERLPTIIIDNNAQFIGHHKSLKQVQNYFSDPENTLDFIEYRRQILVELKPTEAAAFYEWLLAMGKKLAGTLVVNDEIDLTLGTSRVTESHPYYVFCNKGRHFEFQHMATARATQNVPKCLTQQTDVFYIGMAQNQYMIDYIASNIAIKGLKERCEGLEPYRYLKVSKKGRGLIETLKINPDLIHLFKA